MVYNSKTYEVCHKLTTKAEENYRKFLESVADQILWDAAHPIKSRIRKFKDWIASRFI